LSVPSGGAIHGGLFDWLAQTIEILGVESPKSCFDGRAETGNSVAHTLAEQGNPNS